MLLPEQLEQLEDLAAIGYTPRECAKVLGIHYTAFLNEFEKPESPLRAHYETGALSARAEIELAQLASAKTGNHTATVAYRKMLDEKHFETMRDRMLRGDL